MQAEGLRPSTACLTSAISACMHGGQPARAEQLFERMYAICKPDASTFNCLVCVYCRLGKHQQAANMLEVMLRGGQHVDLTTFDAAIDACWATGVVPLQKYALQLYERAHQQGLLQVLITEQVSRLAAC
jgi:pentatricopeptide repeat protein